MKTQPRVNNAGASVPGMQPRAEFAGAERETSVQTRVYWEHNPTAIVTSFSVEKSVDMAAQYTALATIAFSTTGPNYDSKRKQFFYVDNAGQAGAIYRITATGEFGTSDPVFAITPPDAMKRCLVIGYICDAFGNVDMDLRVRITSYGTRAEAWAPNANGTVAKEAFAVGIPITQGTVVQPNAEGMWQVELLRKTLAHVQIPELDFEWAFEVPDVEGPVNLRDIPQLRGADFNGIWQEQAGIRRPIPHG